MNYSERKHNKEFIEEDPILGLCDPTSRTLGITLVGYLYPGTMRHYQLSEIINIIAGDIITF